MKNLIAGILIWFDDDTTLIGNAAALFVPADALIVSAEALIVSGEALIVSADALIVFADALLVSADGSFWSFLLIDSYWLVVYFIFWSVLVPTSHVRLLLVREDGVINHHQFVEEITC